MERNKNRKRLGLSKETVRRLGREELSRVGGGQALTGDTCDCVTTTSANTHCGICIIIH